MSEVHGAQWKVLGTAELLDHIFSYLPESCLLVNISRVCKRWNEALSSPSVQKTLSFRSECGDVETTWSALLQSRFGLFFDFAHLENAFGAGELKSLPWSCNPDAFNRADASWRRMLVYQPACTQFDILEVTAQRSGVWHRKCTIECKEGIRMGIIWDIVQRWCSRRNHWFRMRGPFESVDDLSPDAESVSSEDEFPTPKIPGMILQCHRTWDHGGLPLLDDEWVSKGCEHVDLKFGPAQQWW